MKLLKSGVLGSCLLGILAGCSSSSGPESLGKGKDYLARGDLASAVISFKNAVQADPSSLDARLALGEVLERTGDLSGAEQQYRRALELGGDASDLVPRIAVLLLDRNDMALLVREFADRQLPLPSADSDLRGMVALAQVALGQQDAAEAQLARAEATSGGVRLARAQLALRAGRLQDGLAELESTQQDGKAPWWVSRAVSRVYGAAGQGDKSLAAMKAAYDAAGAHQGVIGEYAERLAAAGRLPEAKPLYERLRKIAPRYYRTHFLEALFHWDAGRTDEAHDAAVRVLAALPEHIPAQLIAARAEVKRGELSSAEERIRKVLAKDAASVEALRLQLVLQLRQGKQAEAAVTLARAMRLAPNDRSLMAAAAELAWIKGAKAEAVKQLAAAAQRQPPDAQLLTRLAEMQQALGRRAEAMAAIDQAIELSAKSPAVREDAFRALVRMKLMDKAKALAQAEVGARPKDPEPLMWVAAVLGSGGDEAAALDYTRKALELQNDYFPALLALAKTASTIERSKEYGERLQKAVDSGTKDPRIYLEQARRLQLTGGGRDQVGAVFDKGVAAAPSSIELRSAAIRHWLAWGRRDRAQALAAEGAAAQPDNVAMMTLVAMTQDAVGNFEQAATLYGQLSARSPDRVDWVLAHAQSLTKAGKSADAIQALRKVIAARPDEPVPYQALAMLQMDEKQKDAALVTAAMLRERPRLRTQGLMLTGDIHARAEDKDSAFKAYDEAAKAGAAEAAALRKIEFLDRAGAETLATGDLKEYLSSHPGSIAALALGARRASAKRDYGTAAKYLEAVVKQNPRNAAALNDLAWAYAQAGNPAALETAKKAIALAPDNPIILDTVAEAQRLAGQKDDAMATLRRAFAIDPGVAGIRVHLAELLLANGGKGEAAELLRDINERSLDKESLERLKALKGKL